MEHSEKTDKKNRRKEILCDKEGRVWDTQTRAHRGKDKNNRDEERTKMQHKTRSEVRRKSSEKEREHVENNSCISSRIMLVAKSTRS